MESFIQSIKDTFTDVIAWFGHAFDWMISKILSPIDDYLRTLDFPCLSCYDGFMSAVDTLLLTDWSSLFGFNVLSQFAYFADFFNLGFGAEVAFCAFGARFILHRLPFIG